MLDTFPQGDAYAQHDTPIVPLGECIRDAITGLLWGYFKADEAMVEGDQFSPSLNIVTEDNLPGAVAADTDEFWRLTSTQVATLLTKLPTHSTNKENAILTVTGGTGVGQSGVITYIEYPNLKIRWRTSDGRLKTALDTTSDIAIAAYWLAKKATNALPVMGTMQQAVAKGKYFWGLLEGEGGIHVSAAVAAGDPLVIGDTAGQAIKQTATILYPAHAYAIAAMAASGVARANINVPFRINQVPIGSAPYRQAGSVRPAA